MVELNNKAAWPPSVESCQENVGFSRHPTLSFDYNNLRRDSSSHDRRTTRRPSIAVPYCNVLRVAGPPAFTAGGPLAGRLGLLKARADDICSGSDCVVVSCECARARAKVATTNEISEIGAVLIPVSRPVARQIYLEYYLIALIFTVAWANAIYIAFTS